jgi:hypothetical protein
MSTGVADVFSETVRSSSGSVTSFPVSTLGVPRFETSAGAPCATSETGIIIANAMRGASTAADEYLMERKRLRERKDY